MKTALYSLILCGTLITISTERTWNHLFVQDPFVAKVVAGAKKKFDGIVVGDSVMVSNFKTDKDMRVLTEQIRDALNMPILPVARCGMTMSAQTEVLELLTLLRKNEKTQFLILELNPAQMLRGVDPKAYAEWQAHLNLVKQDFKPWERLFRYILYLDENMLGKSKSKGTPGVALPLEVVFEKLIQVSENLSEKVFCFITPANNARLKRELTPREWARREKDIEELMSLCRKCNIPCENWSHFFTDEARFPDPGYIDIFYVHLDDVGRGILAKKIAEAII